MLPEDFNIILHPSKGSNYNGFPTVTFHIREFMQKLIVFDHTFNGSLLTWSNHQRDIFLAKKLDRVLINDNWLLTFNHSMVDFLLLEISNHGPTYIQLDKVAYSPPKPFKFFNF